MLGKAHVYSDGKDIYDAMLNQVNFCFVSFLILVSFYWSYILDEHSKQQQQILRAAGAGGQQWKLQCLVSLGSRRLSGLSEKLIFSFLVIVCRTNSGTARSQSLWIGFAKSIGCVQEKGLFYNVPTSV
jgi:hypothetical protein